MLHQPITENETLAIAPGLIEFVDPTNWHDTSAARAVIRQIKADDFKFDFHRNFIRAGMERDLLPDTSAGFEIEEALEELRRDFIADLTGFHPDEHTTEEQFADWIAADRLQATVSEVISAAIRGHGHLGWKPTAVPPARRAVEIADSLEEAK